MDKESGIRKRNTKGNTTKGKAQAKTITKTTKVSVLYWNVEGLRKKRRRILGLRETIWDSGAGREMGRVTELGKNKTIVI
jgi:hypothetical protein